MAEQNLQASELRYRRLFEAAQDGILILDADSGEIIDANPFLKEMLGYSQIELLGKKLWQIGIFKDIVDSKAAFLELQKSGYIRYKDLPLETKAGQKIDVEFVSNVYLVDRQKIIQCNIRDISDRRKVENAEKSRTEDLERVNKTQDETKNAMLNVMEDLESAKAVIEIERAKDDAILASIGEGLIAMDNHQKILLINKAAEEILGWKMAEIVNRQITSLQLEDEEGHPIALHSRPTQKALSTEKMASGIYFFVRKDKTRFPIAITVTPIKLGGKIIGAVDIFRDITHEKEIDRAKSEFVSLASHQLRTPLGIAKWYMEAIREEKGFRTFSKTIKNYLDEVYKSNERLLALVRDLLSVSRIDQGKTRNNPQKVDTAELLKEVVKAMNILAKKNQVVLNLKIKNLKIPTIFIDAFRLQEVIENLITNAVAYSHPLEKVKITVEESDHEVRISVADTGIGISKLDQAQLFTKFFRSEEAIVKNVEGSGLGLYVVKSYVESWGGKVLVESSKGKGSIFTICLPIS